MKIINLSYMLSSIITSVHRHLDSSEFAAASHRSRNLSAIGWVVLSSQIWLPSHRTRMN